MLKRVIGGVVIVMAGVVPLAMPSIAGAATTPLPVTPYSGFNALLTRAPYVTDLTQTSAYINWATTSTDPGGSNVFGSVAVEPMNGSSCPVSTVWTPSAISAPSTLPGPVNGLDATGTMTGSQFTVNGAGTTASEYQNSVPVGGLAPGTTYCYTVFSTHSSSAVDLLPAAKPYQTFTTLMPTNTSSTKPVTFDVIDDTGENYYFTSSTAANDQQFPGANPTDPINPDQASLYKQIGGSGANFLLSVGDIAYNGSSQSTFGDLEQTGTQPEVSDIFGTSYLPQAGGIPIFAGSGDHGQNVTTLKVLPTSDTAAASGGTYAYDSYTNVDGISGAAPDDWYAFSTGNVRIYVLDGSWAEESKLGTANGSLCGPVGSTQATACTPYQADADVHWQQDSPEYKWLQRDLQAHPGGVKMAVFHFPLRSVNATQPSDPYIQNSSANPNASSSLEALLAKYGVSIAFNGHAHTYQRIIPNNYQQNGQLINYVTGGGGGVLEPVVGGSCNTLETQASVYALGWSPTTNSPSACGPGVPEPTSAADVYEFLKVTVVGDIVTVTPTDAAGNTFDVQTYNLSAQAGTVGPGSSPPSQAGSGSGSASTACMSHLPSGSVVGSAATKSGNGYYEVDAAGDVAAFGNAVCYGAMTGTPLTQPIVGMATDPSGQGYWLVARDGGIFSFGNAQFYGSTGAMHLNQPVVGMSATANGGGYWLVAADGGIFSFGDAVFHGSTGGIHINKPVVGMSATADGGGYWLVASDGGIFSFGDAVFHGSTGGMHLNKPVVGMTTTANGGGYWLVASDGGIFSFGDAVFHGSTGNIVLNRPIIGMATDASGQGYWLMASDGGVFSFGDAPFLGSAA
jgi:hypothetical protein